MIHLSKLYREDVKRMVFWGKHKDPRFFHYNFDITTEAGFDFWYKSKRQLFSKRVYKVENEALDMVGFITIKHIQWVNKQAEMGIVFDPKVLSMGYGSQGIMAILEEFFENMHMNCLTLKVATFNERAKHTYLKCGFKLQKTVIEPFEYQQLNALLMRSYDDFDDYDGVLHTSYHHMVYTKDMYRGLKVNDKLR